MALKSIAPIRPTASTMPQKSVAPMTAAAPKAPLSQTGARTTTQRAFGLQPIGDVKKAEEAAPKKENFYASKTTLPYAFQQLAKNMPSTLLSASRKFDSSYYMKDSDYSSFMSRFDSDFGPGELRTFQTTSGPKQMYDYQYQNLLRYGDPDGPAMLSEFTYRDGRWWSIRRNRQTYDKFEPSVSDPFLSEYMLSEKESLSVYHAAKKLGLSERDYKSLYQSVFAKKYFMSTAPRVSQYIKALSDGVAAPDVSTTAQYGSLFGKTNQFAGYKEGISELLTNIGQMSNIFGGDRALPGLGMIGETGEGFMGEAMGIVGMASQVLAPVFSSLWGTGAQKRAGFLENLLSGGRSFLEMITASYKLWETIFDAAGALFKKPKSRRNYNLINDNGKIIDKYSDITNQGDADGIGYITNRAIENGVQVTYDDVASMLGSMYRYRVAQKLNAALRSYDIMLGPNSYFKDVNVPVFYGRK